MRILLVEDDRSTGELLAATLTTHHYTVDLVADGETGLDLAARWNYDLVVLDGQLPQLDGISVCRQLRLQGCMAPILILTAPSSSQDIIQALESGADDYVTKPFDPRQVLARIRALWRRGGINLPVVELTWGDLCLNPASAQVFYQQQPVALRAKEYLLLELFLRHPQRIFSRAAIIDCLWALDECPTRHAVTNLIKDLRRHLKAAGMHEELIETIYGLGYRLKAPEKPAQQEQVETEWKDQQTVDQIGVVAIQRIAERFQSSLARRLSVLEATAQALQAHQLSAAQQKTAREEAHRLAGNLGTFGYEHGSELVRAIEYLLFEDVNLDEQKITHFSELLAALQQELSRPPLPPALTLAAAPAKPIIWLVGRQDELTETLQQKAPAWELQLDWVQDEVLRSPDLIQTMPAAILLLLNSATAIEAQLAQLQSWKRQFPLVPVLILSEQDNFEERIQAARLGAARYLSQPITPDQVFQSITQLLLRLPLADAKVMVVDDDPITLETLTHLLQPWGFQVSCLSDPNRFWQTMTAFQPDLLLLDIEMPSFNGIELCQVVRQDSRYNDLPILVVTAHSNLESLQQVFAAGADDLISKPILGQELVTRVISRIDRSRVRQQLEQLHQQQTQLLRQQSRTDTLTQIANRRAFDDYLQQEWLRSLKLQQPLSLILSDVDCFKRYNDQYGHLAGDFCLREIAKTIQNCLNMPTDQVARYGGEEFVITLPNTPLNDALRVANRIQQAIAQLSIPHEGSSVSSQITLSLGITGTIPSADKTCEALIATADQALYAAKAMGRNTYCLYPL